MRSRRILVTVAALVVLVAAPATTAAAGSTDDQDIADEAALTLADVPEGFEQSDTGDDDNNLDVAACAAIKRAADKVNAAPNSEVEFGAGSGDIISLINNQVTVLPSAKQAKALFRPYDASRARRCLNEGFAQSFENQASGKTDVTADFTRFTPGGGDDAVGYEGTIEVNAGDETLQYFAELDLIRIDRGLVAFLFLNTNTAPPSDDVSQMVETVVTRLQDALAA